MNKRIKRLTVSKRRRREGKTNYKARLSLLLSETPRLVVRKSNMYITAQIVTSIEAQDKIEVAVNSKEIEAQGWKGSMKNISAAYLTGAMLGKKAEAKKIQNAILDLGLHRSTKGNWIYACVKGITDAGIEIPHKSEMLPSDERIQGKDIKKGKEEFATVKNKILGSQSQTTEQKVEQKQEETQK